jgi:hypothetical protein
VCQGECGGVGTGSGSGRGFALLAAVGGRWPRWVARVARRAGPTTAVGPGPRRAWHCGALCRAMTGRRVPARRLTMLPGAVLVRPAAGVVVAPASWRRPPSLSSGRPTARPGDRPHRLGRAHLRRGLPASGGPRRGRIRPGAPPPSAAGGRGSRAARRWRAPDARAVRITVLAPSANSVRRRPSPCRLMPWLRRRPALASGGSRSRREPVHRLRTRTILFRCANVVGIGSEAAASETAPPARSLAAAGIAEPAPAVRLTACGAVGSGDAALP